MVNVRFVVVSVAVLFALGAVSPSSLVIDMASAGPVGDKCHVVFPEQVCEELDFLDDYFGEVCDVLVKEGVWEPIVQTVRSHLGETKFASSHAQAGWFGGSVAISGDNILVGAILDNAAYLYQPDSLGGWTETRFTASDGQPGDWFGGSVAISGDSVVIGAPAPRSAPGPGAAYLYQPDSLGGWTETKFTASEVQPHMAFGRSVAISGDNILIGAPFDGGVGSGAGTAYLYQPDGLGGWTETGFTASNGHPYDNFGGSVAIRGGSSILIGASRLDTPAGVDAGAAYLYQPNGLGGWAETKFAASDAQRLGWFGVSVAFSDDNILIGAPLLNGLAPGPGAAYLYRADGLGGWTETKFTASDSQPSDHFGMNVAASGDNILIGALSGFADQPVSAAYLYQPDGLGGWTETKFTSGGCQNEYDGFGRSVAISGDNILIGAPFDETAAPDAGAAYLYRPTCVLGHCAWPPPPL